VLPDLPGHGDASEVRSGLPETAKALSSLVEGPAAWVGYSLGGRLALHVAAAHPAVVGHLVLVSSTPGIQGPVEREARRGSDEALARRLEGDGVEEFVRWWLSQPMFATLAPERSGTEQRLANSAAGLASSLRLSGTGAQEPLWGSLAGLGRRRLPVLIVAGQLDAKYVAIAQAMATAIGPSASVVVVEGAGHACHLERPEVVGPAVRDFLRRRYLRPGAPR